MITYNQAMNLMKGYKKANQYAWKTPSGKVISNDEFQKRENKKIENFLIREARKQDERILLERKTKTKSKPNKSTTDKSKSSNRSRTIKTRTRSSFRIGKTRKKIKTFPSKHDKSKFFYSNKLSLTLPRAIEIFDLNELEMLKEKLNDTRPHVKKFFEENKTKNLQSINLGYKVEIVFTDKDGLNPTVIKPKGPSFLVGERIKGTKSIDQSITNLSNDISKRFQEYLERKGFAMIRVTSFEAEIENA